MVTTNGQQTVLLNELNRFRQWESSQKQTVRNRLTNNDLFLRQSLMVRNFVMEGLLDRKRNIDEECGYPVQLTPWVYRAMYDREGIAERVVNIYPQESWAMDPEFIENQDPEFTECEQAWFDLNQKFDIWHYLERVDELSGIGYFGIMLYGLNDGRDLREPVEGINNRGEAVGTPKQKEIIFLRTFDETQVKILQYEKDERNPRFGLPVLYHVRFIDPRVGENAGAVGYVDKEVHWSRVLHFADNRKSSEVFGTPRMQPVYNRLYDLRKVLSGSGEMFWKGAFPGYAFEVNPEIAPEVDLDKASLRSELDAYSEGLQRYLALTGVKATSLAPQVSDPTNHVDIQLKVVSLTMGVPYRVFLGSEEARLSSTQDTQVWNKRLVRRQSKYINPMVIRPTIERFMAIGVLPRTKNYTINWPDLNTMTDEQKADIAVKKTTALVQYVSGMVESIIGPKEFLVHLLSIAPAQADVILKAAEANLAKTGGDGLTGLLAMRAAMTAAPGNASGEKGATDLQSVGTGGA